MREKERRSNIHRRLIILSVVMSILITYFLLSPFLGNLFVGTSQSMTSSSVQSASRIDRGNYVYPYYVGLDALFNITSYNPQKAVSSFRKALARYPFHFYSWYGLARTYYEMNERERGNLLFDTMLDALTINDELAWNSGIFLFVKGENERGGMFLRKYLMLNSRGLKDVLDLCYRLNIGINSILFDVLDNRYEYYEPLLNYLAGRKELDDIEYVWNILPHDSVNKNVKLRLCDTAIRENRHELAATLWKSISVQKTGKGGVSNGDFEYDLAGGCFGWTVGKAGGMRTDIDRDFSVSGLKSFTVQFDGEHNPGIVILKQTIPVDGGSRYRLEAYMRTKDITTTNGLIYAVRGTGCRMKTVVSEQFTGTNRWRPMRIEFLTPDDCSAVTVALVREKSRKFNNKIGGTAWVDTVTLSKTE